MSNFTKSRYLVSSNPTHPTRQQPRFLNRHRTVLISGGQVVAGAVSAFSSLQIRWHLLLRLCYSSSEANPPLWNFRLYCWKPFVTLFLLESLSWRSSECRCAMHLNDFSYLNFSQSQDYVWSNQPSLLNTNTFNERVTQSCGLVLQCQLQFDWRQTENNNHYANPIHIFMFYFLYAIHTTF